MLPPLSVRRLTESEQTSLEQGLRSKDAFTLLHCAATKSYWRVLREVG
ncbi:hypothetical protein LEP3755_35560 [Leptolyngbya sp. NIES-3755]|nr:hypothetical protein LEP3755_35560 [Leptolyngbya sp. NIES-3755]